VPVRISVLIPALDEAAVIGAVVRHTVETLPGHEVIVVDGGSKDDTAEIAATCAAVVRTTASRGSSLNDAARIAHGNVLLFLHADTRLPADAGTEIARVLREPRVVGGAFGFAFDESCAMARVITAWVNFRSRAFNVFLGDQALFVRKDVFLRAGGFRDWSLMEDLEILRRLRRFGRLRMTRSSITTSARRHVREGWLRTTGTVWLMTWLHFVGVSTGRLTALYRRRLARSR
jgi:rSAM/selenodomain-associated transferase 2